jgi:DNA-binding CsgD family transcriptional regulator/tetratricopeptide (TPR) repeat protein
MSSDGGDFHTSLRRKPTGDTLVPTSFPTSTTAVTAVARLRAVWPLVGRNDELTTIETMLREGNQAVFLFGPAGVGKTRLASELRARVETEGGRTFRIVGTATSAGIPFAAVAHLLPPHVDEVAAQLFVRDASNEAAMLVGRVQQTVRAHNNEGVRGWRRAVVFVDDAHLLDSLSATVVSSLIANGDAQVVATVRSGDHLPDALLSGLRSGESTRIDVGELSADVLDAVLQSVFVAPVEPSTLMGLRSSAVGNMLYLRELVIGAVESGAMTISDGMWRLVGKIQPTMRLRDLLSARLVTATTREQHTMALLAVAGRMPLELLELLANHADLVSLEESGIISIVETAPSSVGLASPVGSEAMFAHPLFGEEVLARLSKLRLRSVRLELADALEASGSPNANDVLRVAVLRLDAGVHGNAEALERGARLARYAHDFLLTARLSGAAFASEPTAVLGLLLGEALYETGRFDEAVTTLRSALALTSVQRQVIAIGGQLLTVLFWGVADDIAAAELVSDLSRQITEPECVGALLAHRASIATFSGRPAEGLQFLDYLPTLDDPVAFCQISVTRASTLSLVGRTKEALENADRALELHAGFSEPLSLPHASIHTANGAFALLHGGSPEFALARAIDGYDLATRDGIVVSLVWCQLVAGDACIVLGRAANAINHFETALRDAKRERFRGQVAMALAGLAMAQARLGDIAAARIAMQRSDQETSRIASFELNICAARATVMAAHGEYGSASQELQRGVEFAAAGGNVIGESWMLHELVRLGMYVNTSSRLSELALHSHNSLLKARAEHARWLEAQDAEKLIAVAEQFMVLGSPIVAAEVARQGSSIFRKQGDVRRANSAAQRSVVMLAGTDIEPLTNLAGPPMLTPLTAREREIAYLAAEHASNKEISERLFLSSRTVENHLSKVFVKLGVVSRQALRASLEATERSTTGE